MSSVLGCEGNKSSIEAWRNGMQMAHWYVQSNIYFNFLGLPTAFLRHPLSIRMISKYILAHVEVRRRSSECGEASVGSSTPWRYVTTTKVFADPRSSATEFSLHHTFLTLTINLQPRRRRHFTNGSWSEACNIRQHEVRWIRRY
jgi:hypothetical protein